MVMMIPCEYIWILSNEYSLCLKNDYISITIKNLKDFFLSLYNI